MHSYAELIGFIAGTLGIFIGWPQARKVHAEGHGRGVSLSSWAILFIVTTSWSIYGIRLESPSIVISNVAASIINFWVVLALVSNAKKVILQALFAIAALAAFLLLAPEVVVSLFLISLMFGQVPQVYASFHNARLGRSSAVSFSSLYIRAISLAGWELFGIITHAGVIQLTSAMGLTFTFTIYACELVAKSRLVNS